MAFRRAGRMDERRCGASRYPMRSTGRSYSDDCDSARVDLDWSLRFYCGRKFYNVKKLPLSRGGGRSRGEVVFPDRESNPARVSGKYRTPPSPPAMAAEPQEIAVSWGFVFVRLLLIAFDLNERGSANQGLAWHEIQTFARARNMVRTPNQW